MMRMLMRPHTFLRFAIIALVGLSGLTAHAKSDKPLDIEIAEYAIKIGGNRLAKKASDGKGLTLLRLGGIILPKDKNFLLITAKLERGIKFSPIKCSVSEQKLLTVIASRAKKLGAMDPDKNPDAVKLALAYYLVLERFDSTSDAVLLGLQRLKAEGVQGRLDDVLNRRIDMDAVLGKKKSEPDEDPVVVKKDPEPDKPGAEKRIITIPADKEMASLRRTFDIRGRISYVEREIRKKKRKPRTHRFGAFDGGLKLTSKAKVMGDFTLRISASYGSILFEVYGTQIRIWRKDVVGKGSHLVIMCAEGKLLAKTGENLDVIIAERKILANAEEKASNMVIDFQNTKEGSFGSMRFSGTTVPEEE